MSQIRLFAIRDNKVGTYNNPFCASHLAQVTRDLTEVANDPKSMLCKHPQDFELYELGTFDSNTGAIDTEIKPRFLHNISEFKTPNNGENNG